MKESEHKMAAFANGYNYRGYCVYRDGKRYWYYQYEDGGREYVRSLSHFRSLVDYWERRGRKEGGARS